LWLNKKHWDWALEGQEARPDSSFKDYYIDIEGVNKEGNENAANNNKLDEPEQPVKIQGGNNIADEDDRSAGVQGNNQVPA
jgi:hypothetical protein